MPGNIYRDKIYPLQDKILKLMEELDLDFYLTGGTALSRCYLYHRYSDDLDFFVNDLPTFKKQCKTVITACKEKWHVDISTTSDSFVRFFLEEGDFSIKIDFVNDVPFHYGKIENCSIFHRVDNWRNILSNKICALSRLEAKDLADILYISKKFAFEWEEIINEAKEKDLWVDPLEICRMINEFPLNLMNEIKWIKKINLEEMIEKINVLHDDIFRGNSNSLFVG
jgi:predicted nucleotidyltransferase component of viral defense system